MTRNADRPDVQEDTDQWDWVPVEPRRDRHKAAGAMSAINKAAKTYVVLTISHRTIVRPGRTYGQRHLSRGPDRRDHGHPQRSRAPVDGSPTNELLIGDTATTTTPAEQPSASNDNEPETASSTQSVSAPANEPVAEKVQAEPQAEQPVGLDASNDNSPVEELPATGTDQ
jgi:hypothetical protein